MRVGKQPCSYHHLLPLRHYHLLSVRQNVLRLVVVLGYMGLHRVEHLLNGDAWWYDTISFEVLSALPVFYHVSFLTLGLGLLRSGFFVAAPTFLVRCRLSRSLNHEEGLDHLQQAVSRVGEVSLCLNGMIN